MNNTYIYPSLTRISDLADHPFQVDALGKKHWSTGDYVALKVNRIGGGFEVELASGRMIQVFRDDILIGALGVRHATLEATGSWKKVNPRRPLHVLTGAGLVGLMTSKSIYVPELIEVNYLGHVMRNEQKVNMQDFALQGPVVDYQTPTIVIIGTSMSAGKTTSAKIIIRLLRRTGLNVVGCKLTGAGRYKDILSMQDSGAGQVFDFVDVGLPSSIHPAARYREKLIQLLSAIQHTGKEIAVAEIGASPLEPYNGDIAFEQIRSQICFTVLCASDPYAVLGVMESFQEKPDLVSGIATNTLGGIELIESLCKVRAMNIIDHRNWKELTTMIDKAVNKPD